MLSYLINYFTILIPEISNERRWVFCLVLALDFGSSMVASPVPPGFIGLDILRQYIEKRRSNRTALMGAFRGQCTQPQHRSKGLGTWNGPLNLESASARLTIGHFRRSLAELGIILPDSESDAIFHVMSVGGTVSVADLLREIRLDPCDRNSQWGQGVGQNYLKPSSMPAPKGFMLPTMRSGYTQGPHRGPLAPFDAALLVEPLRENLSSRIAPTRGSGYANSVASNNALVSHGRLLQKEVEVVRTLDAATLGSQAAAIFRSRPKSAGGTIFATTPGLLHTANPDGDEWTREGIGRNRPKSAAPTHGNPARTEGSGYTRLGGVPLAQPHGMVESKPERVWARAEERFPWTSGYNRGAQEPGVFPSAREGDMYGRDGIGRNAAPPEESLQGIRVQPPASPLQPPLSSHGP